MSKYMNKASAMELEALPIRKMGFYEKYIKRFIDVACAAIAIIILFPVYICIYILVRFRLGTPVLFIQERPGLVFQGKETIFKMYKFRTMTDARNKNGELLPDRLRLTEFGKWLRSTSLDELPELFNILKGDMSLVGPRPQLVRDLVFMSKAQRMRHTARPGLSGLAQVNGRNAISWEEKFAWDLKYIRRVSFFEDVAILLKTVQKALLRHEGINETNQATAEDLGDYLLRIGKISKEEYRKQQTLAKDLIANRRRYAGR